MEVNFYEKGEGKVLILIHGWGGSIESLRALGEDLANRGYKVYGIELPGFGISEAPLSPLKMQDFVKFLEDFIKEKGIGKYTLIGHSFGGKLSLFHAVNKPKDLENIVLINSSGIKPKFSLKKELTFIFSKIFGLIFKLPVLNRLYSVFRFVYYKYIVRELDYYKSEKLRETFKLIVNEHIDKKLKQIKNRTLILWGSRDKITPLYFAHRLNAGLENSQIITIEDIGHALPLKMPNIVAEKIDNFLKIKND